MRDYSTSWPYHIIIDMEHVVTDGGKSEFLADKVWDNACKTCSEKEIFSEDCAIRAISLAIAYTQGIEVCGDTYKQALIMADEVCIDPEGIKHPRCILGEFHFCSGGTPHEITDYCLTELGFVKRQSVIIDDNFIGIVYMRTHVFFMNKGVSFDCFETRERIYEFHGSEIMYYYEAADISQHRDFNYKFYCNHPNRWLG